MFSFCPDLKVIIVIICTTNRMNALSIYFPGFIPAVTDVVMCSTDVAKTERCGHKSTNQKSICGIGRGCEALNHPVSIPVSRDTPLNPLSRGDFLTTTLTTTVTITTLKFTRAYAELLFEGFAEVGGAIEADFVGDFGDGARVVFNHLFGQVEAVVADKIGC